MAASIDPEMSALMLALLEAGGSDLHISANSAAYGRINGELQPLTENRFSSGEIKRLIYSLLSSQQQQQLEKNYELDCAYELKNFSRFRLNIYKEKNNLAACLRSLGNKIPSFKQLGLAQSLLEIIDRPNGLVLVTGPTGSGKSSSLAAILEHINQNKAHHIITVEDPIEFLYQPAKSLIHQRELGEDTHSFANALRAALREDPDVILVGELRDLETIQLAISAAETGHLVFATLHTNSAAQTIERLIDVFPAAQQSQIRMQLSGSLLAVFAQTLCRAINKRDGCFGRVMAQEIMINNNAIANLIREGKTAQIYSQLQTGSKFSMQTMEQCLANLINNKQISIGEALTKTARPAELQNLLMGAA
jgi:twitching motility protein PilT